MSDTTTVECPGCREDVDREELTTNKCPECGMHPTEVLRRDHANSGHANSGP